MAISREIVKIFLGSPSDLVQEQKLFRDAVNFANEIKANMMGFQFEAISWENLTPAAGRPQGIINEKCIADCDIVTLLLWKRWGTPSGNYSSGFEEEYELAKSLYQNQRQKKPQICIYFRQIPEALLLKPDRQLKQVLKFREKIIKENKFLFNEYQDEHEWKERFIRQLCSWLDDQQILRSDKPWVTDQPILNSNKVLVNNQPKKYSLLSRIWRHK